LVFHVEAGRWSEDGASWWMFAGVISKFFSGMNVI
jgi:hypothetical protein